MGWRRFKARQWGVAVGRGWHQPRPSHSRLQRHSRGPPGAAHRCSRLSCPKAPGPVTQRRCWQVLGEAKPLPPLREGSSAVLCHGLPVPSVCMEHPPAPLSPCSCQRGPLSRSPSAWERMEPPCAPPPDGDTTAGCECQARRVPPHMAPAPPLQGVSVREPEGVVPDPSPAPGRGDAADLDNDGG